MSADTTDRREAERVERRVRREVEGGTFNRVTKARLTLRDAFDLALSTHWAHAKSHHSIQSVAGIVCLILGADLPLDEVTTQHVVKLKAGMRARGVASGTTNRKLAALQKLITLARHEWGVTMADVRFDKEKEKRGRLRWLSTREETQLLGLVAKHTTHHPYADLFAFLMDTGCRFSEAQRLRGVDVLSSGRQIRLVDTKNGDSRTVPLTERARALVAGQSTETPWGHLSLTQAERAWQWARQTMSLADDKEFVIHALRHTFASRLVQRGVHIEVVSKLLGHRTLQQTMVYAHLAAHNYTDAVAVLEPAAPSSSGHTPTSSP